MGAFVQDQCKINDRFAITPGLRYDWQNFLATRRLGFSPRVSFAWVLDPDAKTVLRGGGGIYYDRFGGGPLLDLARYENARRRSVMLSLRSSHLPQPAACPSPTASRSQHSRPPLAQLEPNAKIPYQIQYGLSIERQLGERATGIVSVYSMRGIDVFRSVDINAPTPESGYTVRPNPAYGRIRQMQPAGFFEGNGLDISYRGRWNKYFTGFGRYTWSHYESNTGGISWFPQNQYEPNDEWSNAGFDRRQRLGMYAIFNQKSVFNLATGIFANTGRPGPSSPAPTPTATTSSTPAPTAWRATLRPRPGYVDLDLRWGHDFAITPNKADEAPRLGFSAGAFNVLNHAEPLQHRHRRNLARLRRSHLRQPAPPHPARHALRVLAPQRNGRSRGLQAPEPTTKIRGLQPWKNLSSRTKRIRRNAIVSAVEIAVKDFPSLKGRRLTR